MRCPICSFEVDRTHVVDGNIKCPSCNATIDAKSPGDASLRISDNPNLQQGFLSKKHRWLAAAAIIAIVSMVGSFGYLIGRHPPVAPPVRSTEVAAKVNDTDALKEATVLPSYEPADTTVSDEDLPWSVAETNRQQLHEADKGTPPSPSELKAVLSEAKPKNVAQAPVPSTKTSPKEMAEAMPVEKPAKSSVPSPAPSDQAAKKKLTASEVIEKVKDATVFIQVLTSVGEQSGSGVLYRKEGSTGTIVTNAHVITPDEGTLGNITCVFRSGTRDELALEAKVVGQDDESDLAVLAVSSPKLPDAIEMDSSVVVGETSAVLAAGFPFGASLATNERNPSITITKGSVSSVRRDDFDQVALLQIEGGIHSGNSGGPVVTETGELVGIAVAKVRGTNIGFAIPQNVLTETLDGRLSSVKIQQTNPAANNGSYRFDLSFINPNKRIVSAKVFTFAKTDQSVQKPDENGRWPLASEKTGSSDPIRVHDREVTSELKIPTEPSETLFQIQWTRADGSVRYSQPASMPEGTNLGSIGVTVSGRRIGGVLLPEALREMEGSQIIELPSVMSDFAINPSNGDIVSVSPLTQEAFLFRSDSLKVGAWEQAFKETPPKKCQVGDTPIAVVYKRFGDQEYFAVVCTQDSHLYLLSADKFQLVKKIPLGASGNSDVTTSRDPRDPFLYYSYGSGHDSSIGAVNLRSFADQGPVLTRAMDIAISANGKLAYRRGPWSPSGFESLQINSSFADSKPQLTPLISEHRSTGAYVPDPFSEYTATGNAVYSSKLDRHFATLSFVPSCFFETVPVVVGIGRDQQHSPSRISLQMASSNTFKKVGNSIEIPREMTGLAAALPRGVDGQADFKRVGLKTRVIADDVNRRVIYAVSNRLATIPIDAFDVASEPFLRTTESSFEMEVGVERTISVIPGDSRVKVELKNLPEGATRTGTGFKWKPKASDSGEHLLEVTLSHENSLRVLSVSVTVRQPSFEMPIEIAGLLVDPQGSRLISWSGNAIAMNSGNIPSECELCSVPLQGKGFSAPKPIEHTKIPLAVRNAVLAGNCVALLSHKDYQKVFLYDVETLKLLKTLIVESAVNDLRFDGEHLVIYSELSTDHFDTKTFTRISRETAGTPNQTKSRRPTVPLVDGLIRDGVLWDETDGAKPKLILEINEIPALGHDPTRWLNGSFLLKAPVPEQMNRPRRASERSRIIAGPVEVPETVFQVSLENLEEQKTRPGQATVVRFSHQIALLVVDRDGVLVERVPIVDEIVLQSSGNSTPVMQVANGKVFVSRGNRVYQWTAQNADAKSDEAVSENKFEQTAYRFEPVQSTLVVSQDKTSLQHKIKGGSEPYDFFLVTRLDGVTANDATGEVVIDRRELIRAHAPELAKIAKASGSAEEVAHTLKGFTLNLVKEFKRLVGRKPDGFPVAIPIHLKTSDSVGEVAEIQYFVLVELPLNEIAKEFKSE